MWLVRLWYLLALLAFAALAAAALTLPGFRDEALERAADRAADLEGRLLLARLEAALDEQRRVAEGLARDPRLHQALDHVSPELEAHLLQVVVGGPLKAIQTENARFELVLLAPGGAVLASTAGEPQVAQAVAASPRVAEALARGTRAGLVRERWVAVAPVPSAEGPARAALAVVGERPTALLRQAHGSLGSDAIVLSVEGKEVLGSAPEPVRTAAAGARPGAAPVGPVAVDGGAYRVARWAAPAPGAGDLALAWRVPPPARLEEVGGPGALLRRLDPRRPEAQMLLGAALLVWLLGALLLAAVVRPGVRRLSADVRELGAGVPVRTTGVPGWLRPVALAANEAAADIKRAMDKARGGPPPPSPILTPPPRLEPAAAPNPEPSPILNPPARLGPAMSPVPSPEPSPVLNLPPRLEKAVPPAPSPGSPPILNPPVPAPEPPPILNPPPRLEPAMSPAPSPEPSPIPNPPPRLEPAMSPEPSPILKPPPRLEPAMSPVPAPEPSPLLKPPPRLDEAEPAVKSLERPPSLTGPTRSGPPSLNVVLPAIEDDEAEPEPGTDAEIRLPGAARPGPPPLPPTAAGGGLLERIRAQGTLEPDISPRVRPEPHGETVVRPVSLELLSASRDPSLVTPVDEAYFQRIYEEFVATKARCGEPTDNLDYARFRDKLLRTRATLIHQFHCEDVRFRVYEKDGRAALKASPVLASDPG